MPLTSRKSRPIPRTVGRVRDARLFVVATEDRYAPKQYFGFFSHPRVHVEVLPTESGGSAPEHIVNRLVQYATEYQIAEDDQLWVLLDTDHWIEPNHKRGLIGAIEDARRRGYRVAMSNPCFDLWLLLHHRDLQAGQTFARCDEVGELIRAACGEFNKTNLKAHHYPSPRVPIACTRARGLEAPGVDPVADFWPEACGSRVYLLIEELRNAGMGFEVAGGNAPQVI